MDRDTKDTDPKKAGSELGLPKPGNLAGVQPQKSDPTRDEAGFTIWRTLGRLLHEAIFIGFFIGLHWAIKWWLLKTNQQNEWWAEYLSLVSVIYAIVAFTVIFGSELIVDCKHAIDFVWKSIWKKP